MLVDDRDQIEAIAALYKQAWSLYPDMPFSAHNVHKDDPRSRAASMKFQERSLSSNPSPAA
jgi:hypothetical protein